MRRQALTILSRARKRSTDSENQPIALLRPGSEQHHFHVADAPASRDQTTVPAPESFREITDPVPMFASR